KAAADSGVPVARFLRSRARLTRPWRSSTACTVLLAGKRRSPASLRMSSSLILGSSPSTSLTRAPMRLVALEIDNQPLHLVRQLSGVAHRPARAIGPRIEPLVLVAIEDLVAGLAGNAERTAHLAPAFALKQ